MNIEMPAEGGSAFGGKKILILHTSIGLGHKSIAENIGFYLSAAGYEVRLADIGSVQKGRFEKIVVGVHQFINKHLPFVWGWLYRWGHFVILPFRVFIAGFNYRQAKILVDEFKPDLIISTQTTASAVVAYLKQKGFYKNQFAIAFSDFHLHPYWLYNQADFYLVNIFEQAREMLSVGIAKDKVFICGIILKPKLFVDLRAVREKFGIRDDEKVVLIGTGSLGLGFKEGDLEELAKLENTKIIFACGKNEELYKKIKNLNRSNVIPLSFYSPMDELYSIADIFVGKPGGLSTAESLRWNLPLLVTYVLPGQEEKNLEFLSDKNLVLMRTENLSLAIKQELQTGMFREALKNNPEKAKLLGSGGAVVEAVNKSLTNAI